MDHNRNNMLGTASLRPLDWITIGAFFLATFCEQLYGWQDSQAEPAAFVSKYTEAAKSPLFQRMRSIHCTSVAKTDSRKTGESEVLDDAIENEYWKCIRQFRDSEWVIARNPSYSFNLKRKDTGYLLAELTQGVEFTRSTSVLVWPIADRWAARSLMSIFCDPTTTFHRVRLAKFENQDAIEVAVGYPMISASSGSETQPEKIVRSVRYFLHPNNYLLLGSCEYSEELPYNYFNHVIIHYGPNYESIEKIVETVVKQKGVSKEVRDRVVTEVTAFVSEAIDQNACYLSYYGLPEPIGEPSRRSEDVWGWVVVGSVVFTGSILGLRAYRKRSRS